MAQCCRCKLEKADEEFAWEKRDVKRSKRCRACQRELRSVWYEVNKEKYKVSERERVQRKRREFIEWLATQSCMDCGTSNPVVLEFDHVRGTKVNNIAKMFGYSSDETLQAEIEKCDIVCANCHRIRTAERGNWYEFPYGQTRGFPASP